MVRWWILLLLFGCWEATTSFILWPTRLVPGSSTTYLMFPSDPSTTSTSTTTTLWMGVRGKRIRRRKNLARKEATPPRIETPYGPIRLPRPPQVCDTCQGRGKLRCHVCEGRGAIRATGIRKSNQIDASLDRLVGSQWTSVEVYHGHRHHTVMEVQGSPKRKKNEWLVRMRNCCGEQTDFWILVAELRDKMVWRKGWQTLEDIQRADGGPLLDARPCFRCKGGRILLCVDCNGLGEIPSYEPLYD